MSMKKLLSVFFVFMLVSYLSTVALAQAKGIGHGQGHAPDVSPDHGQNHDKNIDHDSNHAGTAAQKDAKLEADVARPGHPHLATESFGKGCAKGSREC